MKREKKTARRLAPSSSHVQGSRRGPRINLSYHNLGKMQAPIRTGEGVPSPVTGWNLLLEVCGTGWLVACMFRLIDWLERG